MVITSNSTRLLQMLRRRSRFVGASVAVALLSVPTYATLTHSEASTSRVVGVASHPTQRGFWTVGDDGAVFANGSVVSYGSMAATRLNSPIVGIASSKSGDGYWLAAADGGVFSFGDAHFFGSAADVGLRSPIVGIVGSATGQGYWMVAADGGVFTYGDAAFLGSMGAVRLNAPVTGIAATPSGRGYWLSAADGGVFSFGDASYLGSMGDKTLQGPITAIAASSKTGYTLLGSDGGIFNFGASKFIGSALGRRSVKSVGIAAFVSGGYAVVNSDGSSSSFSYAGVVDAAGVIAPSTTPGQSPTVPSSVGGGGPVAPIQSNFDMNKYILHDASVPASSSSEPSGNFRMVCQFSHLSYDDPIVSPGQTGFGAHLHMFFGNTLADKNSSYQSLRTTGDGSCIGGPLNRTAYWAPAMINGNDQVVVPDYASVYYKSEGFPNPEKEIGQVAELPAGLKMIAGQNMAGTIANSHEYWACELSASGNGPLLQTIPQCPAGERVGIRLEFPQCWDGVHVDSPDHRSHMSYAQFNNGIFGCDAGHPVHLPQVTIGVWWTHDGHSDQWHVASDRMPGMANMPNGSTFHSDWFGAWDPAVMTKWMTNCVRGMLNCSTGQLGGTDILAMNSPYSGPKLLPQPARPA